MQNRSHSFLLENDVIKTGFFAIVLVLASESLLLGQAPSPVTGCPIRKGAFSTRTEVEQKWISHALEGSQAIKQLRQIDAEYLDFQFAASSAFSLDPARLRKLCTECSPDPIAQLECSILLYKHNPDQYRGELLKITPTTKGTIRPLEVAQFPTSPDPRGVAEAFKPSGPAYSLVAILLHMAKDGDPEAFTKLVGLTSSTEGELAEGISDKMAALWATAPEVFEKNWDALNGNRKARGSIVNSLSSSQAVAIKESLKKHCVIEQSVCEEIGKVVNIRVPTRKK